jgi:hypothetical protein
MSERGGSSPKAAKNESKRNSLANRVAELILQSCRSVDSSAHISSVLRDSEGRTIVRVRADPRNDPNVVLGALQARWPLARSSVHENALDGIVEAEIIVPRERDEQRRAWNRAKRNKCSEFLFMLALVLFFMSAISYGTDCYHAFLRTQSANATFDASDEPAPSTPADTKKEL